MKTPLMLSLLLAVPALAGTSQVTTEYTPPPPVQDAWSFFVGGTGGYLFEADEDIYTFQLGAKSPWSVAGWSVSLFAEVGWTENHDGVEIDPPFIGTIDADLDIIPLTFNVQFDKMLSGGWSLYAGGGVGASYIDGDIDLPFGFGDDSVDDWVFTSQVFAGVAYHVSENFAIFGGGRWLYIDEPDGGDWDLGCDWMVEGGVRFHF